MLSPGRAAAGHGRHRPPDGILHLAAADGAVGPDQVLGRASGLRVGAAGAAGRAGPGVARRAVRGPRRADRPGDHRTHPELLEQQLSLLRMRRVVGKRAGIVQPRRKRRRRHRPGAQPGRGRPVRAGHAAIVEPERAHRLVASQQLRHPHLDRAGHRGLRGRWIRLHRAAARPGPGRAGDATRARGDAGSRSVAAAAHGCRRRGSQRRHHALRDQRRPISGAELPERRRRRLEARVAALAGPVQLRVARRAGHAGRRRAHLADGVLGADLALRLAIQRHVRRQLLVRLAGHGRGRELVRESDAAVPLLRPVPLRDRADLRGRERGWGSGGRRR